MKKKLFSLLFTTLLSLAAGLFLLDSNGAAQALSVNSQGEINNLVCFVNFAGEEEFVTEPYLSILDEMYNTSEISVKNYFSEVSLGKLNLSTHFLSASAGTFSSVTLSEPIEYYMPRYELFGSSYREINALGYDNRNYNSNGNVSVGGSMTHAEAFYREQMMVREIVKAVKSDLDASLNLDNDGDGYVDSVTFILNADAGSWNDLLWPHMTQFQSVTGPLSLKGVFYFPDNYFAGKPMPGESPYLNGAKCNYYDLQLSGYIFKNSPGGAYADYGDVGVLTHELMHIVGAPDLYRYYNDTSVQPAGELDIMDGTDYLPQYPLTYIREKLGWAEDGVNILPINESGSYTLKPVNSDDPLKAYKIVLPDYGSTGEYFMLEVRSNSGGSFDSTLSAGGLIIYRVDESAGKINQSGKEEADGNYGNMYGPPDEVYVFRDANAAALGTNAYFGNGIDIFGSQNEGVTPKDNILFYQGRSTGERSAYRDKNSGIVVSDISVSADGSVTFSVTLPSDDYEGEDYAGLDKVAFTQGLVKYPYIVNSSVTETGFSVKFKSPYAGQTAYWMVADAQSEIPTYFQVKKGTDYGGNKVYFSASVDMPSSGDEYTGVVTGLRAGTEYRIYLALGSPTSYSAVYYGTVATKDDTTAPVITFDLPESCEIGSEIDIGLSVVDDVASAEDIEIDITVVRGGEVVANAESFTPDKTGVYTVTVTARDYSGNSGVLTKSVTVKDTVPPQIQISLPERAQTGSVVRLEPIVKDNGTPAGEIEVEITVRFGGEIYAENVSSFVPSAAGVYIVEIVARDGAGNADSLQKSIEITDGEVEDATPPAVSVDALSPREGDIVTVGFAATDNATAAADLAISVTVVRDGEAVPLGENYSFTAAAGEYLVTVKAVDEAGNTGEDFIRFTVADKTPPSISIFLPEIAEAGSAFKIEVTASDNYTPDGSLRYKIEIESGGVWTETESFEISLNKGVYTVRVTVYDEAGNCSSDSGSVTVTERKKLSFSENYPKIYDLNKNGFKLAFKLPEGGYTVRYLVLEEQREVGYEDLLNGIEGAACSGSVELPYAATSKSAEITGLSGTGYYVYAAVWSEKGYTEIFVSEVELKEAPDRFDFSCAGCSGVSAGNVAAAFTAVAAAAALLFKRR